MKTMVKMSDIRSAAVGGNGARRFSSGSVSRVVARDTTSTAKAYGVEIELPCRSITGEAEVFREMDKLPIDRKSDGSLSYEDIEFVFPPMSPNQWRMSKLFDQFIEQYERISTRRTARAYGTHIHTNVRGWHPISAALVRPLVTNNAGFFKWLAGRAGYDPLAATSTVSGCGSGLSHRGIAGLSRHGTVEYRLFDSTTDRTRLLSWMRWLDAIEEYVRDPAIIQSYRTKQNFTEESDPFKTIYDLIHSRRTDAASIAARERLYGSSMADLLGVDVLDPHRFRQWLTSDYVRDKYPVVYNSYRFWVSRVAPTHRDSYTGDLSYAENLNDFLNGGTTDADASSPRSAQSA